MAAGLCEIKSGLDIIRGLREEHILSGAHPNARFAKIIKGLREIKKQKKHLYYVKKWGIIFCCKG